MSDFTDLFLPPNDPKHLSLTGFIQKEETNLNSAVQKLPAEVQPFVTTGVVAAEGLASVLATVAGTALGAVINTAFPAVETAINNLLARAGAGAATPAAQSAATTIEQALQALITQMVNQAKAGLTPTSTPPSS
jgi:hypothetical protein